MGASMDGRYRKKESGRRKRREQSRRHRRRQQERKRRGEDVLVAVEAPAWVITQEKRSSSCDRPGCYESFERMRSKAVEREVLNRPGFPGDCFS